MGKSIRSRHVLRAWVLRVVALAAALAAISGCAVDAEEGDEVGAYEAALMASTSSPSPIYSFAPPPPESCPADATLSPMSMGFTCACYRACMEHWTKYDVRGGQQWTGPGCLVACRAIRYGACNDPFPPAVCLELPNKDWMTICTASKEALCAMLGV